MEVSRMTTEEMIETIIDEGVRAYIKNYRNCLEGRILSRHEIVTKYGINFTCWKEYTVYKVAEYIKEIVPTIILEVEIDGNNYNLIY